MATTETKVATVTSVEQPVPVPRPTPKVPSTPLVVPLIDFDTPTGDELVQVRKSF